MLAAVARERERIALAVDIITEALRRGGRLFFVGAGTSGRLGVLEAAEMPPTFSTSQEMVRAVVAGGKQAVFRTSEGVEDRYAAGVRAVRRIVPSKKDVFVGVSASGITQFVRGALSSARKAGARILFVTCDPASELQTFVDLTIALGVGPEVITGSTRLKAGSATKLVLNMLTTTTMIQLGKVHGNLMVDLQAVNKKLRDRSLRIVMELTRLSRAKAKSLLERANGKVKPAVVMHFRKVDLAGAAKILGVCGQSLRKAMESHSGEIRNPKSETNSKRRNPNDRNAGARRQSPF
jgi:N-acetylmuramic acid 6-phosphate etherase